MCMCVCGPGMVPLVIIIIVRSPKLVEIQHEKLVISETKFTFAHPVAQFNATFPTFHHVVVIPVFVDKQIPLVVDLLKF